MNVVILTTSQGFGDGKVSQRNYRVDMSSFISNYLQIYTGRIYIHIYKYTIPIYIYVHLLRVAPGHESPYLQSVIG